jgi:hypothetical protein
MKEEKKEELFQLLGGWVLLSPILAYIFHVDPMTFWLFIGGICYVIVMVGTCPWAKREVATP